MHSEARLLMHKPVGQTDFVTRNIVSDAQVFQQYRDELEFIEGYNRPDAQKEIYLTSISVIPQNIDKLFMDQPAIRPELPPGVRRLELDDAPEPVKSAPTWTVSDYTQYIKQTQLRIDNRDQGYTLLSAPLFMFTTNSGPVAMANPSESVLQQALLIDLHNGFSLSVPSRKIKQQGRLWIYLNNPMLKEIDVELLVILNFEVEPFNLSQQIWPSLPIYPQPGLGYPGTWIRYDINAGNATAQPVRPDSAPRYSFNGGNYVVSGAGGTNRTYVNGEEVTPTLERRVQAGHRIFAEGTSPAEARIYVDGALHGINYIVPAGRSLRIDSASYENSERIYVVRGTLV